MSVFEELKAHKNAMLAKQESILRLQLAAALDTLKILSTCHEKTCCSDRGHKCTCFASIAREGLEKIEKIKGGKGK